MATSPAPSPSFLASLPAWAAELVRAVWAKQAHVFILHGMASDLVPFGPGRDPARSNSVPGRDPARSEAAPGGDPAHPATAPATDPARPAPAPPAHPAPPPEPPPRLPFLPPQDS